MPSHKKKGHRHRRVEPNHAGHRKTGRQKSSRPIHRASRANTAAAGRGVEAGAEGTEPARRRRAPVASAHHVLPPVIHRPAPGSETTLDVENTISPVDCSGKIYPARKPFLVPPYHGFVQLISYFDHDLPDFTRDGLITLANGLSVTAPKPSSSRFGVAGDFPAYWSDALRQYVYYDGHNGYDFGLVYQPVYAAASGRVIFAGWNYPGLPRLGYGQMVMIDHGAGYVTLYGHFSRIEVYAGERVKSGQQIGVSGNTGHSSGPHLHFTVFHNCKPTDPYGWTGRGTDPLSSYQGETSSFLWRIVPPVFNPIPGWPATDRIGASPSPLALNLTLPQAPSIPALLSALARERAAVARAITKLRLAASYDWAAAAFSFPHPVRPATLLALPYAASITLDNFTGLYESTGSFTDRLAQLLWSVHPGTVLRSGRWSAFLLHYQGHMYVAGHGPVGSSVAVTIPHSKVLPVTVVTDGNGGYVDPVPAGSLRYPTITLITSEGRVSLRRHPRQRRMKDRLVHHVSRSGPPTTRIDPTKPRPFNYLFVLAPLALACLGAAVYALSATRLVTLPMLRLPSFHVKDKS